MSGGTEQTGLAGRLRRVVASMRADLDVSRHVFRDGPSYVVRDPTSCGSFRLSPREYVCLTALDDRRPLGATFEALVESGDLEPEHEEEFYSLVVEAHRGGLLSLPINDAATLHERHERRRRAHARSLLLAFVSLRIPLLDPSDLLDTTVWLARPLFTRGALAAWAALMAVAVALAVGRWDDLVAPIMSMAFVENLPLLWVVLVVLKVAHEFGHAYACRVFGGHVPEMGVLMILLTPCAYVDATDSWRFTARRHRLVVGLAGMYVESILGAIALIVWSATPPGLVNTVAHQTLVMATLVTVAFNLNPLMRFDGYYILGDALNIPNLRRRARAELVGLFDRYALGLRRPAREMDRRTRSLLVAFGASSMAYRVVLTLSICALVATRFYFVGLALAAGYLAATAGGIATRSVRRLWTADPSLGVRVRGAAVTLAFVLAALACLAWPVAPPVRAVGVVGRAHETVVRAPASGELEVLIAPGTDRVASDTPVARIRREDFAARLDEARAELRLAETERRVGVAADPATASRAAARVDAGEARVAEAERRHAALTLAAPHGGRLIDERRNPSGLHVQDGEPVFRVVDGGWLVRVAMSAVEVGECDPTRGEPVRLRLARDPSRILRGRVVRVSPSALRSVADERLTESGDGRVVIDPDTGEATEAQVMVEIELTEPAADDPPWGARAAVTFESQRRSVGGHLLRRVQRFINRLHVES
jgi:putative peptide zinc metalloprotease protein